MLSLALCYLIKLEMRGSDSLRLPQVRCNHSLPKSQPIHKTHIKRSAAYNPEIQQPSADLSIRLDQVIDD